MILKKRKDTSGLWESDIEKTHKAAHMGASPSKKNIQKQLKKNRSSRTAPQAAAVEKDEMNALEGQTIKERIAYLKGLNGTQNSQGAEEGKKDVDIERLDDDVLIERPIPMTMAATLYPIKDIRGGMIITNDNRYVRIMEVSPINFQLKAPIEQNKVTGAFESFLRIAPENFQMKVLAKKTDLSFFTKKMDEDYQREQNENCRKMILDGKRFLYDLGAYDSVSRRFFLVFEVPQRMAKGYSVDDIKERSSALCGQIADALSGCGNKVVPGYDDSKTVYKMIFDIMNRERSSSTDYEGHVDEVCDFYERTYGEKSLRLMLPGELVTPFEVDMRGSDYIKMGNTYYGFYYVRGDSLPSKVYSGWVTHFTNLGEGVDADIYVEKQKRATQQERVRRNLLWKKHDISGMSDTTQEYDSISGELSSGYYLKNGLSSGEDFYFVSFMITVTADSLKGLRKRMDSIREYMRSQQIDLRKLRYEQDRALQSYMPLARLDRKIYRRARRNMLTEGLASNYPFMSSELCDPNGILLGINEMSGSICHVDIFDTHQYKNANVAILGCTGAGKSYLVQLLAKRFRQKGIQVFILAPDKGYEFARSCEAVGGQFIHVSPGGRDMVNIMELRPRDREATDLLDGMAGEESELSMKIQSLHNFFGLLIPDLTLEEDQVLDEAIIRAYAKKGITNDNDSLWDPENPGKYKAMPILGDVYAELEHLKEAGRLAGQLRRLVSGSASSFNQQTNVDLDNLFIVMDVTSLKGTLLSAGMYAMLEMAYSKAKEDRTKRKVIIVDEAWEVIGSKSTSEVADQILEMFKIIRGYGGAAICATQDVNDFFSLEDGKYGKGIINACQTKIILNLERKEAETVKDLLDLSMDEYEKIRQFEKGHALLSASGNNVPIHVMASREENDLITTDRRELDAIRRRIQKQSRRA